MTNPFITNVSRFDITQGWHEDVGTNSVLIQIIDEREGFPVPKYDFLEIHQFVFDDVEDEDFKKAADWIVDKMNSSVKIQSNETQTGKEVGYA